MLYTTLTKKALKIAYEAHFGQVDKAGEPYFFHPLYLANQMTDEETTCVALLHDVVEDTNVAMEVLAKDFPHEVIEALTLLTHDKQVDYIEYVKSVKTNPIAKTVKLADLHHNSDISRIEPSKVTEKDKQRLEKYKTAIKVLLEP